MVNIVYKRRFRWNPSKTFLSLYILILLCMFMYLILYFSAVESDGGINSEMKIAVQRGDTLWSLANKYYPNQDPRKTVARIREINELDDPILYPGQVLELSF